MAVSAKSKHNILRIVSGILFILSSVAGFYYSSYYIVDRIVWSMSDVYDYINIDVYSSVLPFMRFIEIFILLTGILVLVKKVRTGLILTSVGYTVTNIIGLVIVSFVFGTSSLFYAAFADGVSLGAIANLVFAIIVTTAKKSDAIKNAWFIPGIVACIGMFIGFCVDYIVLHNEYSEYRYSGAFGPLLLLSFAPLLFIGASFTGWKWIADEYSSDRKESSESSQFTPVKNFTPTQYTTGYGQQYNSGYSQPYNAQYQAPQQGRIVGYNTQTGAPIYEAPAVSQNGRIIGYDPHTGAPIYETPSPSQGRIVGYDPHTGVPIYENQANITQKKIIGYDPHTGAPIYG